MIQDRGTLSQITQRKRKPERVDPAKTAQNQDNLDDHAPARRHCYTGTLAISSSISLALGIATDPWAWASP